jgi:serine O-acetyltransferase
MKRPRTDKGEQADFARWMDARLPKVARELEQGVRAGHQFTADDGLDFAGRHDIYEILDDVLAALFPGSFSRERVSGENVNFFLTDLLRHISFKLDRHLRSVFNYRCKKDNCDNCDCDRRSGEALMHLIESLPEIRGLLMLDIEAAFEGDPAARFRDEIMLSYPCIEAIATHRIAHLLYELEVPIIPRIMAERAHSRTGIDIHPGARIGSRFFIDHGTGVVIGETCRIGNNVKIYQGVTLGALSPFDKEGKARRQQKRHPDIEDDVIIYANATILGGRTVIGRGAVIGGNTWITESVPAGAHVFNRDHRDALKHKTEDGKR